MQTSEINRNAGIKLLKVYSELFQLTDRALKISDQFMLYPSHRYYKQTAVDYYAPYEENLSTSEFYTSDYDLSEYTANQFGFGVNYTDIFSNAHLWKFGLKSIDLKFYQYDRNTTFTSSIISAGFKFVMD